MTISRRRFLQLSSLFAAPAIIDIDRLMKVAPPTGYIRFDSGELLAPSGKTLMTTEEITRIALEEFRRNIIDPAAEQLARDVDATLTWPSEVVWPNTAVPRFEPGDIITIGRIPIRYTITA